ncbi:MAG: FAD-dependent oxidoreductase [Peptococcaceae bacterium]|jgi:NADPH-dependent 2,4-dienoyl-CoA reductase/sulfur reductase-like enzyme|nr:FAD-dependent oxidoreductase [Peptococcaceae bacterium]
MGKRLIVIGGVAAGMSAASKAARQNKEMTIDVYTDESYISYSACSLPYYTQDVIDNKEVMIARSVAEFGERGVRAHPQHKALRVDPAKKAVLIRRPDSAEAWEAYDRLVIATGARPIVPPLPGIGLEGVFTVKQIPQAERLKEYIAARKPARAVIAGGGFIGAEMAEALLALGLKVTVLEMAPRIMTLMDEDMAALVAKELRAAGAEVITGAALTGMLGEDRVNAVASDSGEIAADLVILAIGVKPNTEIAQAAGIELGFKNAIRVNERMETNLPDIYAAGDCAAARHLVTGKETYIPLGTTANKQGKIAGENAAGGQAVFKGVVGTTIFKVIEKEGARTGLSLREAGLAGIDAWESTITSYTRAAGYPGRGEITVKLVVEKGSRRLLGGQIFGAAGAGKRIDVLAALLQTGASIDLLAELDLAYAPPFSPVWDPLLVAANQAVSKADKME